MACLAITRVCFGAVPLGFDIVNMLTSGFLLQVCGLGEKISGHGGRAQREDEYSVVNVYSRARLLVLFPNAVAPAPDFHTRHRFPATRQFVCLRESICVPSAVRSVTLLNPAILWASMMGFRVRAWVRWADPEEAAVTCPLRRAAGDCSAQSAAITSRRRLQSGSGR